MTTTTDYKNHLDWASVERAYELWEAYGDIDTIPTREQARGIAKILVDEGLRRKVSGLSFHTKSVIDWFTNRQMYSPYIDEVAIERALNFDQSVLANLTRREEATFRDRLRAHKDPFGFGESLMVAHPEGNGGAKFLPLGRGAAFHRLPKNHRERLQASVQRPTRAKQQGA